MMSGEYLADALAPQWRLSLLRGVIGFLPRMLLRLLQWFKREPSNISLRGPPKPVAQEVFTRTLVVTGTIPPELNGLYVRTGANPQVMPSGAYHAFDGEAMLHAVYFSEGKAMAYHNHWLRTPRWFAERAHKAALYLRLGDMQGALGVALIMLDALTSWRLPASIERAAGGPLGNTALAFHGNRLLALMEGGYPYVVRVCRGLLASVGLYKFGGALETPFTAHPKVDPGDGVMHAFAYLPAKAKGDWLLYYQVSPKGELSPAYPIHMPRCQMMHDFSMTENYAVFMDHSFVFDPELMVKRGGLPFAADTEKQCRIGLVRKSEPERGVFQWFPVENFVFFHTINSWEEPDGRVCVCLCRSPFIDLSKDVDGDVYLNGPRPTRYTLHLGSGVCTAEVNLAPDCPSDFPAVVPQLLGRRQRYAYVMRFVEREVKRQGAFAEAGAITKIDLLAEAGRGEVATITMPGECINEPYFVHRDPVALAKGTADVDDGFLIAFVSNMSDWTSTCKIWDAKTMAQAPLATVRLPQRVPSGFHGLFVTQEQLDSQDASVEAPRWPLETALWAAGK